MQALERANAALASGDLEAAESILKSAADRLWTSSEFYQLRANLNLGKQAYRAAVEDLIKASHIALGGVPLADCAKLALRDLGKTITPSQLPAPDSALRDFFTALILGNSLRAHGDFPGARAAYEAAMQHRTGERIARLRLACLLAATGDTDAAQQHFASFEKQGGPESIIRIGKACWEDCTAADPMLPVLEPIRGALSTAGSPKFEVTAIVSCDARYFDRFAAGLSRHLDQRSELSTQLFFHVVNPTAQTASLAEEINAQHPSLGLTVVGEARRFESPESPRTYYACARFLSAPGVLEATSRPVLILDADMMVLKSLRPLQAAVQDKDVGAFELNSARHDLWDVYQASALWIQPTVRGRALSRNVAAYISYFLGQGEWVWYLDQIALFAALSQMQETALEFVALDPRWLHLTGPDQRKPSDTALFWSLLMSIPANQNMDPEAILRSA